MLYFTDILMFRSIGIIVLIFNIQGLGIATKCFRPCTLRVYIRR